MLGIIGGVGPKATARLYLSLTERACSSRRDLPPLLVHSIAMTSAIEDVYLAGRAEGSPEQAAVRRMLTDAVHRLRAGGARRIAMPCNTLQDELEAVCHRADVPHLNMADATARAVAAKGLKRVLLLATNTTCRTALYRRRLAAYGVACVHPGPAAQAMIDRHIRGALDLRGGESAFVDRVADLLAGCDGIVVGCTDLCGDVSALRRLTTVFDSLECLAELAEAPPTDAPAARAT